MTVTLHSPRFRCLPGLLVSVCFLLFLAISPAAASDRPLPETLADPGAGKSGTLNLKISPTPGVNPEDEPPADGPVNLPKITRGTDELPPAVRNTWERLHDAAVRGDISVIDAIIAGNGVAPSFTLDEMDGDAGLLRELSGDAQGHEILAIMLEILEAGYVRLNEGEPTEMYVWPYFWAYPLEYLTARQRVELFRIVTAGDYEEMKLFGAYIFYRLGIGPDGTWHFFLAGD